MDKFWEMRCSWVQSSSSKGLPSNAVLAGVDCDGAPIYCGRAEHCGEELPAKIMPNKKFAYVAFNGEEYIKDNYEVLCGRGFRWITSNGSVPENAISIGRKVEGETMYFGRTCYEKCFIPGKIHTSRGCLYAPHDGREVSVSKYDYLVMR